jgi:hypothetical protein
MRVEGNNQENQALMSFESVKHRQQMTHVI